MREHLRANIFILAQNNAAKERAKQDVGKVGVGKLKS